MLNYVTLIFACQLAGELVVAGLGLAVPGPVVGMLILLAGLIVHGAVPDELSAVGDFLLGNFSLLFVPAGVGVMLHAGLLGAEWFPITAALIASTLIAIAVTALMMKALTRATEARATTKPDKADAP
jgi:holin-like protein